MSDSVNIQAEGAGYAKPIYALMCVVSIIPIIGIVLGIVAGRSKDTIKKKQGQLFYIMAAVGFAITMIIKNS